MKNNFGLLIYKLYQIFYIPTFGLFFLILIRAIRPLILIRWHKLRSRTMGHFTVNTELYLCEQDKKINVPNQKYIDFFYLIPRSTVCNNQLKIMWKRKIKIIPWQILRGIDVLNDIIPGGDCHKIKNTTTYSFDVLNLLDETETHLKFSDEENELGKKLLRDMGIKDGQKFVCLVVRDSQYHKKSSFEKNVYDYHSYRNCNVNNYLKAAEYLAENGIFVIRMGSEVKNKFKSNNKKIIDYATNGMRSDFMDIYLGSKCMFWISTATGIDGLAQIFRLPAVFTNQVPIGYIRTTHTNSVVITKHHLDKNLKRKLSIREINEKNLSFSLKADDFKKNNIELIENTPEEILSAVKELYEKLKNNNELDSKNKDLQKNFWKAFPYKKNIHGRIVTLVGNDFLNQNKYLLNDI
tara:strand:+ start:1576 stop:2799 length:1224 start_codon:yes stop_codon:yes gene_type:complete